MPPSRPLLGPRSKGGPLRQSPSATQPPICHRVLKMVGRSTRPQRRFQAAGPTTNPDETRSSRSFCRCNSKPCPQDRSPRASAGAKASASCELERRPACAGGTLACAGGRSACAEGCRAGRASCMRRRLATLTAMTELEAEVWDRRGGQPGEPAWKEIRGSAIASAVGCTRTGAMWLAALADGPSAPACTKPSGSPPEAPSCSSAGLAASSTRASTAGRDKRAPCSPRLASSHTAARSPPPTLPRAALMARAPSVLHGEAVPFAFRTYAPPESASSSSTSSSSPSSPSSAIPVGIDTVMPPALPRTMAPELAPTLVALPVVPQPFRAESMGAAAPVLGDPRWHAVG
eukprot:scaffold10215_cov32-Tisochrysis_lutea.AAC.5